MQSSNSGTSTSQLFILPTSTTNNNKHNNNNFNNNNSKNDLNSNFLKPNPQTLIILSPSTTTTSNTNNNTTSLTQNCLNNSTPIELIPITSLSSLTGFQSVLARPSVDNSSSVLAGRSGSNSGSKAKSIATATNSARQNVFKKERPIKPNNLKPVNSSTTTNTFILPKLAPNPTDNTQNTQNFLKKEIDLCINLNNTKKKVTRKRKIIDIKPEQTQEACLIEAQNKNPCSSKKQRIRRSKPEKNSENKATSSKKTKSKAKNSLKSNLAPANNTQTKQESVSSVLNNNNNNNNNNGQYTSFSRPIFG
jgi:hypothetical protein